MTSRRQHHGPSMAAMRRACLTPGRLLRQAFPARSVACWLLLHPVEFMHSSSAQEHWHQDRVPDHNSSPAHSTATAELLDDPAFSASLLRRHWPAAEHYRSAHVTVGDAKLDLSRDHADWGGRGARVKPPDAPLSHSDSTLTSFSASPQHAAALLRPQSSSMAQLHPKHAVAKQYVSEESWESGQQRHDPDLRQPALPPGPSASPQQRGPSEQEADLAHTEGCRGEPSSLPDDHWIGGQVARMHAETLCPLCCSGRSQRVCTCPGQGAGKDARGGH
jgi:hypothetical protein